MKYFKLVIAYICLILAGCASKDVTGNPKKDAKGLTDQLAEIVETIPSNHDRCHVGDSIVMQYAHYYLNQPAEEYAAFYDEWRNIMGQNEYFHNVWNDVVTDDGPADKFWHLLGRIAHCSDYVDPQNEINQY